VYLVTIWFVFNINTALLMLAAGVVGFILLETVNYIEHYGLLRSKNDQGRYEAGSRHSLLELQPYYW
jgi:alkane 1-monooxygenase